MKRLLIIAAALVSVAGPALAADSDYQEGSASRDYGYAGSTPRHDEGGRGYVRSYGYGYGYGGYDDSRAQTGYAWPAQAPGYGYGGYGYSGYAGGGYGYAPYGQAYQRSYAGRHGRHRCGCYYYDDDYR
jgi:hypothetical protein